MGNCFHAESVRKYDHNKSKQKKKTTIKIVCSTSNYLFINFSEISTYMYPLKKKVHKLRTEY